MIIWFVINTLKLTDYCISAKNLFNPTSKLRIQLRIFSFPLECYHPLRLFT